jgi:hypothetical protein
LEKIHILPKEEISEVQREREEGHPMGVGRLTSNFLYVGGNGCFLK